MKIEGKILCENCFAQFEAGQKTCPYCGYQNGQKNTPSTNLSNGIILLGKYCIGRVLGRGGFGITYLAYDLNKNNKVAIKEYMPDNLAYRNPGTTLVSSYTGEKKESFRAGAEKFYEEAKIIAEFNEHPNIINVYEFFYENNTAYFVMEYIEGVDLKEYTARNGGKLTENEALKIMTTLCDSLIIIHSIGVLHRDISPDNIYLTKDGTVKLLDFGAARQVIGDQSKSLSVVLKPGFAPPEQYSSRGKQGPWTDIYSLTATIYYCLTGKMPSDAMDRMINDNIQTPTQLGCRISPRFEKIMILCLSPYSHNRYQSAAELKAALTNSSAIDITPQNNDNSLVTVNQYNSKNAALKQYSNSYYQKSQNLQVLENIGVNKSDKTKRIVAITLSTCFGVAFLICFGIIIIGFLSSAYPKVTANTFSVVASSNVFDSDTASSSLSGISQMISANGDVYEGNFSSGLKSGQGTMIYANGDKYVGNWINDQENGQGTMTYSDGSMYVGNWVNNQKSGQGKYTAKDGTVSEGTWADDLFVG